MFEDRSVAMAIWVVVFAVLVARSWIDCGGGGDGDDGGGVVASFCGCLFLSKSGFWGRFGWCLCGGGSGGWVCFIEFDDGLGVFWCC